MSTKALVAAAVESSNGILDIPSGSGLALPRHNSCLVECVEEEEQRAPTPPSDGTWSISTGLSCPGLKHICDNISGDLIKHMKAFKDFQECAVVSYSSYLFMFNVFCSGSDLTLSFRLLDL